MSREKRRGPQQDWANLRRRLIELTKLQKIIREKTSQYLTVKSLKVGEFISYLEREAEGKVGWNETKQFLAGQKAFTNPRIVKPLCQLIKEPEAGSQIIMLAAGLHDRLIGLCICSEEALSNLFALFEAYHGLATEMTQQEFAEIFGKHREVVEGAMIYKRRFVEQLDQEPIRSSLDIVYDSESLESRAQAVLDAKRNRMQPKIDELMDLVKNQLRPHYESLQKVAEVLKCSRSQFAYAQQGLVSEEQLDELIKRGRGLLAQLNRPSPPSPPPEPLASPRRAAADEQVVRRETPVSTDSAAIPASLPPNFADEVAAKVLVGLRNGQSETPHDELAGLLTLYGGGESPLGTQFALTQASFRRLSAGDIPRTMLHLACQQAQLAAQLFRANLHLILQYLNHELELPPAELSRLVTEIREVYLTLQAWHSENPEGLGRVMDSQRGSWISREVSNGHKQGGKQ